MATDYKDSARAWLDEQQKGIEEAAGMASEKVLSRDDGESEGFWAGIQRKAGEVLSPSDEPGIFSHAISQQVGPTARVTDDPKARGVAPVEKKSSLRDPTAEEIEAAGNVSVPAHPQVGGEALTPAPADLTNVSSGGSLAPIRRSKKEGAALVADIAKDVQKAGDELAKADMKAAQIASQMEQNKAALAEQQLVAQQSLIGQQEDFESKKIKLLDESMANLEDARANFRHFGVTPEERRHHQSVIDSPFTTDEEKQRSSESLRKAQSIDHDKVLGGGAGQFMAFLATAILGGKLPGVGQVVNMLMQRDLASQKAKGAAARISYQQERDRHADLVKRLGSEEAALLATRDMKLEAAQALHAKNHSSLTADQHIANSEKFGAQLEQERAANQAKLEQSLHSLAHQGALQESRIKAEVQQRRESMALRGQKAPLAVEGLEQTGKTTVTSEGFKKVQEAKAAGDKVMEAIDKAIALREKAGGAIFGEHRRALDRLGEEITTGLAGISGTGVLNAGEYERFKEQVGDLSNIDIIGNKTINNLKGLRDRFQRAQDTTYKAYGFKRSGDLKSQKKKLGFRVE